MKAMPIPEKPTVGEYFTTALGNIHNTYPFACTHHPAMNVPCAKSKGLPVGMMLIGRHFEEDVVLRVRRMHFRNWVYINKQIFSFKG